MQRHRNATADGKPQLFEHRHFEWWLARWAGANLRPDQCSALARDLARTNSDFKMDRFLRAVEAARAPAVETCDGVFIAALRAAYYDDTTP